MTNEQRIDKICEMVMDFGRQMVDYSHAGGGPGGFYALGMLGDIRWQLNKLASPPPPRQITAAIEGHANIANLVDALRAAGYTVASMEPGGAHG